MLEETSSYLGNFNFTEEDNAKTVLVPVREIPFSLRVTSEFSVMAKLLLQKPFLLPGIFLWLQQPGCRYFSIYKRDFCGPHA